MAFDEHLHAAQFAPLGGSAATALDTGISISHGREHSGSSNKEASDEVTYDLPSQWHVIPDLSQLSDVPRRRVHSGGGRPGTGSGARPLLAGVTRLPDGSVPVGHHPSASHGPMAATPPQIIARPMRSGVGITRPRTNSSPTLPNMQPPKIPDALLGTTTGHAHPARGSQASSHDSHGRCEAASGDSDSAADPSIANASRHSIATSEASSAAAMRSKREKGIIEPHVRMHPPEAVAAAAAAAAAVHPARPAYKSSPGTGFGVRGRTDMPEGVGRNRLGLGGLSSSKHVRAPMVLRKAMAGDEGAVRALTVGGRSMLGDEDRGRVAYDALLSMAPSVRADEDEDGEGLALAPGIVSTSAEADVKWAHEDDSARKSLIVEHIAATGVLSERSGTVSPAGTGNVDSGSEAGRSLTRHIMQEERDRDDPDCGVAPGMTSEEEQAMHATVAAAGWKRIKSRSVGRGDLMVTADGETTPPGASIRAARTARRSLVPVGRRMSDSRPSARGGPPSPTRPANASGGGDRSPRMFVLAEDGMPEEDVDAL